MREDRMYVTWEEGDDKGRAVALAQADLAMDRGGGIVLRSLGSDSGIDGATIRHGLAKKDYDRFRPGERKPRKPRDIQKACFDAYDDFGLVRNIHDTMADFAVKGVDVIHPVAEIDEFYRKWFLKVRGPDISCMMALMLLLTATCPVLRHVARLRKRVEKNLRKGIAGQSEDVQVEDPFVLENKCVPWQYTLLDPTTLTVMGNDLAPFIGPSAFRYAVDVPPALINKIKHPKNDIDRELVMALPEDIRLAIRKGANSLPIDPNRMRIVHYKKFDWQVWGTPMTYSLLDDLNMLKKLKLADLTALDGCISHIRLWKLGSLENRMMPTKKAIERLAELLALAGNGSNFDLIWGPDIDLKETSTDIHHFLGQEKYVPHLTAIYAGYGIPPSLTGMTTETGFTNNAVSLKIMTERLAYVRSLVEQFWKYEISLVQEAMGFRLPARVRFDRMVLTDEAAEKALLVQLADRDLISILTLQERFGEDPLIEEVRQRAEARKRKTRKIPQKAGPWHDPQTKEGLTKLFVQQGVLAPSEVGVEVGKKKEGEISPIDQKAKIAQEAQKDRMASQKTAPNSDKPGQPQQGRPMNSKDTKKRKQKRVLVRTKARLVETLQWAEETQKVIAELLGPVYLRSVSKKNMRQLTDEQTEAFEKLKFALLVNMPMDRKVDAVLLTEALKNPLPVPVNVSELLDGTLGKYRQSGAQLTIDKQREFQAKVVAMYRFEWGSTLPFSSSQDNGGSPRVFKEKE